MGDVSVYHMTLKNIHGDMYDESFKSLDEMFQWIEKTVGDGNISRLRVNYVPVK